MFAIFMRLSVDLEWFKIETINLRRSSQKAVQTTPKLGIEDTVKSGVKTEDPGETRRIIANSNT